MNYNLVTGLTFSNSGDVSHPFLGASSDRLMDWR